LEKRVNYSNEEKQFKKTTEWQGIYLLCGSRKYPYPPPPEGHGKFRGGGSKAEISEGSGGFIGSSFSRG